MVEVEYTCADHGQGNPEILLVGRDKPGMSFVASSAGRSRERRLDYEGPERGQRCTTECDRRGM